MKQSIRSRGLALLLALVLLGSLIPPAAAAEAETKYTININPPSLAMEVGDTNQLTAVLAGPGVEDEAVPEGITIVWSSTNNNGVLEIRPDETNPLRATVEAVGTAETTEERVVTVTVAAQRGGDILASNTCSVTVAPTVPPSLTITPAGEQEMEVGAAVTYSAAVTPPDEAQTIAWRSSDPSVATVSETGVVTGVAPGRTTITASAGSLVDTCTVIVRGINLPDTYTAKENVNVSLTLDVYGESLERAVEQNNTQWSSSDETVVRVVSGYIYPLAQGTATITATVSAGGRSYTDSCTVTVERNVAETITATVEAGAPLAFSNLRSRIQTQCSNVLGASLSYISGLTVSTSQGTLYYRYQSEGDTGLGVGSGERYYASPGLGQSGINDLYFVPKADFSGSAEITYMGYISDGSFFQGTIVVTVTEAADVTYSTVSRPVQFNVEDFTRVCRDRLGGNLSYVIFSQPDSDRGALYYQYVSEANPGSLVRDGDQYRGGGSPSLGDVYFVPETGFSGQVVIPYTAYDVNGNLYRGRVTIQVSVSSGSGDINYTLSRGGSITFDSDDFNDLCREFTGYSLDYVQFTPPVSSEGTLTYDGGSKVSAYDLYYRNSSPYLRRVRFQAADGFAGTVYIPFIGWDIRGNRFSGTVELSVGNSSAGDIRYTVFQGGAVTFDVEDFNDLCRELTDRTLSWIQFTELPSRSRGDLVYNYDSDDGDYDSRVTSTRRYYRSSTPRIDRITFLADDDFTGSVTLSFTGRSTYGDSFSGTVVINVRSRTDEITYTTDYGSAVSFDASDFDALCRAITGDGLRSVRFTLPSSYAGTLYYNGNTAVSAYQSYGYSSSPYLDRVEFRPADGFSGTVTVAFTGQSTGGDSFRGTVSITVEGLAGASLIAYSTTHAPVTFQSQDFAWACWTRGLGSLQSVRFTLPSSNVGRLYYRYAGPMSGSAQVQSATSYYPLQSPGIGDVTFVPKAGYRGMVVILYTATDSRGNQYQGQVQINVQPNTTSQYFTDMGNYTWAAASVDYLYEYQVVNGTGGGRYSPAQSITRGDFVLMVYRAMKLPAATGQAFSDVPAGSYYAQAITAARALGVITGQNNQFRPTEPITRQDAMVILQRALRAAGWTISDGSSTQLASFTDGNSVADYARGAVAAMVEYGVITGTSQNTINPGGSLSRAEMAVMMARVLTL